MKNFEYKQIDYIIYPTTDVLNKEGSDGWEIVNVFYFTDEVFDDDECEYVLLDKIKVTFKREIDEH